MPRGKKSAASKPATPKVAPSAGIRRPSADDVRRAVADVNRQKTSASEYSGLAGQATAQFCERWNIDKKAFGFVRRMAAMEDQKRQAMLVDFADLCRLMGFTDQESLFEDTGAALDSLKGGGEVPDPDEVRERTEAELAEAEPRVKQPFAETLRQQNERVNAEIGATINGGALN